MKRSSRLLLALAISSVFMTGCKKEMKITDEGNLVPKTVEFDLGLPAISANGTKLHAETYGNPDSPMVVFLHGGPGGDYRNGLPVKQLAGNGYYVVFYDQRGSGLSKRHPKDTYNIQVMFDDLSAVIGHYRTSAAQKVFLFGHSWGAILAAGYINKYPAQINGVIFAEPGGFNSKSLEEYGEKTRKLELFKEATNDILYKDQFLSGKENDHAILDYKLNISSSFAFAKGNIEGVEGPSPYWRNGAVVLKSLADIADKEGYDFTANLRLYNTKVLFLYSENNKAYGLEYAQKEAAYFSNKQISRVNGTGHEMIFFKWDNVYPVVLPYLNSLK